ncbi:Ada metal-binding domain-containing protein [Pelosinus propionicus]|uniref:Methylphosphotriester-DNA--protein-cysteine methyltransferase (N-terminal of Ada), contains Zn-binding and two AraC-type DNA-binding domains n=1 Tax=Pelosinus propionicus DSM 13327 TaxID=1123291 RepID=A0A1I4Q2L2_9FIRM|nr:Ada metal-binding domain-containing protein [Pelosinus propionicus]SFM34302.1 Methylphosphotriester-DNA--protein-cysteine methyltransferase (N-terminal fragment of Ada), contains Zn-binding and two AraC-type DNA-binding domains [Pelosinus propionicus DSM 13327]
MSAPLYYLAGDFEPYRSLFLQQSCHIYHYKTGDVIFESHTEWDSMMYLTSGTVKLSIIQNDKEKLLAFYSAGYLIPYYIPDEVKISHLIQFTAISDVTVLKVSKQDFEELLTQDSKLRNEIYLSAWKLLHLLTHELESQSFDSGLEKVATFLYTYFENTGHVLFEISTRDLQSFVGLNRTNTSKYLSFLTRAHVIEKERGVIKIVAPEKLKNFCSERVIRCDIVPSKYIAHSTVAEENKWQAIYSRDATYDGVFWYGVKSTGIFCIPSCKSKPPLRENIEYFDSPKEALDAGYRVCKRCRPDIFSYNPNRELLRQVRDYLDEHFCEKETVKKYLKDLSMDSKYLNKLFKMQYDITPHAYVQEKRFEKAIQLLTESDMSILDIALSSGFNSMSNFYSMFKNYYGMSPTQYRQSEKNER